VIWFCQSLYEADLKKGLRIGQAYRHTAEYSVFFIEVLNCWLNTELDLEDRWMDRSKNWLKGQLSAIQKHH
jgi:hypothetical protein